MKANTRRWGLVALPALALMLAGCGSSMQARSVDAKQSLLVNPSILKRGTGDQALYRYVNPKVDVRKYSKILIDPVLIEKQGKLNPEELENYQKLSNNAYVFLTRELEKDYRIVHSPEPGTMRFQMAIIDAEGGKSVRNLTSTILPIGMAISVVQYTATGKPTGVGEITAEFKITDAMTGELLGAALDRRVGGKNVQGVFDSWDGANSALKYWAARTRYVLCTVRGEGNCEKP